MNVSLSDDLGDWAQSRVTPGGFADASDYVRDVVRRDRAYEERLAHLQTAIDEGRASPISERTIEDIIVDGRRRRSAG